ncbi:hypothetical protein SAMN03159290_02655 [Pseudomonas sp. NFACC13-1]|nr:hypothetical protein SAMN03159290_02655 [Pseudomonas sp. NFACC13-1]
METIFSLDKRVIFCLEGTHMHEWYLRISIYFFRIGLFLTLS